MAEGIQTRHRKACRSREGGRCSCTPSYRSKVVVRETRQQVSSPWTTDRSAAMAWRRDALTALAAGARPRGSGPRTTVSEHIDDLIACMRDGRVLTRSGERYRPATIRSYEQAAEKYVKPTLGYMIIGKVRRRDVQDFVDELRLRGLAPSSVHNKLDVLRVVYRRAIDREEVSTDPCMNLRLPAVRRPPKQVAAPERADALLAALPDSERPLWSTLFYAGLRISEARALRWYDVDFDSGVIRVERGWDDVEGELPDPKTDAGRRDIPLAGRLKTELARHKLATGRGSDDLCFGRAPDLAFDRATIRRRARKAWKAADLAALTPHEARHTCASYLIAAGVNDMQLQRYIGHTDVRTTKNIYGHLFPDDAQRVATALDAFLDGPRGTQVGRKCIPPSGS